VGAFGIRGFAAAKDMRMLPAAATYGFDRGGVYNLEASEIIKNGSGLAGAHSDIAHPEVAHAFWAAALAGQPGSPGSGLLGDGGDGGESHPPHVGGLLAHPPHVGGLLAQVLKAMPPGALTSDLLSSVIGGDNSHLLRDTLAQLIPTEGPAAVAAQPPREQPASAGQRWLIAEIEGQPPKQPLLKGNAYSLAFDVNVASPDSAIAASPLQEGQLWSGADSEIEVIVQIASTDFGIANPTSSLRLARAGKALARAQFQVTPLHDGRSSLTATIHKDGNFIQQMDLTFEVGAADAKPVEIAARGRLPSSLSVVQRRDVGLSIRPIG
jgi:hypothetical protein